MTKIFKSHKNPEIRKVVHVDINGEPKKTVALIGKAEVLLKEDIIFEDNVKGNEDKYLIVDSNRDIWEFDTLEEAKDFARIL